MTFMEAMDTSLIKQINRHELYGVVDSMVNEKALGHDGIPIELFKQLWPTIGGTSI